MRGSSVELAVLCFLTWLLGYLLGSYWLLVLRCMAVFTL